MRFLIGLTLATAVSKVAIGEDADAVLKRWNEHVSTHRTKGLHGTARLYVYDEVFQTESRGRVEFWISGLEEWRVDYAPADVGRQQSSLTGPNSKRYKLQPLNRYDRWSRSAMELTQWAGNAHSLPEPYRSDLEKGFRGGLLDSFAKWLATIPLSNSEIMPGVIQLACSGPSNGSDGFNVCRRNHWLVTLGKTHGDRDRIHLVLLPISEELQRNCSKVEVLLKASDLAPIGIRIFDPAGTSNTVYAFDGVGDLPYESDPFGPNALATWPPNCGTFVDDAPPPPPLASPLMD